MFVGTYRLIKWSHSERKLIYYVSLNETKEGLVVYPELPYVKPKYFPLKH